MSMDADALFDLASDFRLLADLDPGELRSLTVFLRHHRLTAGDILFKQGEASQGLWFLVSGKVAILKERSDQPAKTGRVATVGAGQTLGEISLMDGQPHSATATADTDAVLLSLSRDDFDRLLKDYPRLGVTLLRKLGRQLGLRLRRTTGQLVDHLPDA